jgi:hypothetical protein
MAKSKAKTKSKYAAKVEEAKPKPKAQSVPKAVVQPIIQTTKKPAQKTEQAREPVVPEAKQATATWQCVWCGNVQSADLHQCTRCFQAR